MELCYVWVVELLWMWWSCSAGSEVLVCGVVVVWMIMLRIS